MLTAARGIAKPAHNERAAYLANDVDADPGSWVPDSESNEGGHHRGYFDHIDAALDILDTHTHDIAFLSVNTQVGTTYTLVDADNGKLVTCNNASAITVSLNTGLTAGFHCTIVQLGAGQVTMGGTATLTHKDTHTKTEKQDAIIAIMYEGTSNAYLLGGATAA